MKRVEGVREYESIAKKFGVEEVYELECSYEPYQFDLLLCVYDPETKAYWFASDSGCSCPIPFEWVNDQSDFEGPYRAVAAVRRFLNEGFSGYDSAYRARFYDASLAASLAVREHWGKLNADL